MAYEAESVSNVSFLWCSNGLSDVVGVLERAFNRFRGITTEATATFRADDGRESFWFNWWESVNNDIFDPVRMVTRTAAILVPVARAGEGFVGGWFQRILVHRATPQTIRPL